MSPIAVELVRWALALEPEALPETVRRAAARHLLDALGCAAAAARSTAAAPAIEAARAMGGGIEQSSIIGRPRTRVSGPAAALANGVLIHAMDFDDTHAGGLVHASAPVVAAVLAEAERRGSSGAETLTAIVAGLETSCRLGAAAPHAFHTRGLHATAVCGVLAAALACAKLRGLSREQAVNALGIAGSRAGGLLEFLNTGASTKQLHPGFAAFDGMMAAALAAAGMSGPATVLEGPYGVYQALAAREPDRATILGELGERWETLRITIKPYPACQLMHAQLDAAHDLRPMVRGHPADLREIVVEVHPDAAPIVTGPGKQAPRTPYEAKFSLQWSTAAMLVDGEVTIRTYERIDRPEVARLAAVVRAQVVDFGGHAADQPGRVRARTAAGEWVTAQVDRSRGGPDDPQIDATVRAKASENFGAPADHLIDLVLNLEKAPSLGDLLEALENHVN